MESAALAENGSDRKCAKWHNFSVKPLKELLPQLKHVKTEDSGRFDTVKISTLLSCIVEVYEFYTSFSISE